MSPMSKSPWFGALVLLVLLGCGDDTSPPLPAAAGADSAAPEPDAGPDGGHAGEPDGGPDASFTFETVALAPLAGPHQQRAPGQEGLAFHGTDLGYTVHHGGALRIAF